MRIDCGSGDVVRYDSMTRDLWQEERLPEAASIIHSALSQLQGLLPGHYILQHEVSCSLHFYLTLYDITIGFTIISASNHQDCR